MDPERTLKAGVAGAGAFGANHAGKYAAHPRTTLTAVFDVDGARAAALAAKHGAAPFTDFDAFIAACGIVTIAAPARFHADLAVRALEAGRPTLVEKPIAVTHADGVAVIEAARRAGVALACGHQERLVFEAMGLFRVSERPVRIESRREGPWSGRGADVSVSLDLAIHDADLAVQLMGGPARSVTSRGVRVHGPEFDEIEAEAQLDSGIVHIIARRTAAERRRTMRIVYPSGEVAVDFIARTFRNTTPHALDAGFAESVAGRDPLGANVSRFIDAAEGRAARPVVTGEEALAALDLILAIDAAAGR